MQPRLGQRRNYKGRGPYNPHIEEYETWGSGFINTETWLEIVHRSIS